MVLPLTASCIALAAYTFAVPEPSLWTILMTEGGRVGACALQANGSHDCGPAQINVETWAPPLARLLHRPEAAIATALRDDGCFNIDAAAFVLKAKLQEAKGNVWDAMGRYNSGAPARKHAYQEKLTERYLRLFGRGGG